MIVEVELLVLGESVDKVECFIGNGVKLAYVKVVKEVTFALFGLDSSLLVTKETWLLY